MMEQPTATISSNNLVLNGVVGSDDVSLTNVQASFAQPEAGTDLAVSLTSGELAGTESGNYILSLDGAPGGTGTISTKELTLTGSFVADDKTYDGTATVTISSNNLVLNGVVGSDDVSLTNVQASFAQPEAGTDLAVIITNGELTGTESGNYVLSLVGAPGTTASISAKELTLTGSFAADNKTYDGTTTATISGNNLILDGVIGGDDVSLTNVQAAFAQPEAGTDIAVSLTSAELAGTESGNYILSLDGAPTTTADIIQEYELTLVSSPAEGGTATGGGSFLYNDTATVLATPADGYEFVNWTDEEGNIVSDQVGFDYTMPAADVTLTANFAVVSSIANLNENKPLVMPNPFNEYISIENINTVSRIIIYSLTGNIILDRTLPVSRINTDQMEPGIYLLRIVDKDGISSIQKIVKK